MERAHRQGLSVQSNLGLKKKKNYTAGEGGADAEQGEQTTLVQKYCQPDSEK